MAEKTKKKPKILNKSKRLLKVFFPILLASGSLLSKTSAPKTESSDKVQHPVEQNITPKIPSVDSLTYEISFVTDTLDTPSSALMFCTGTKIVRNFVAAKNAYKLELALLVHEAKHAYNNARGLRKLDLSPIHYTLMCIHDEISANICEVSTIRLEYLASENKKSFFDKYRNGRYAYYVNAIEKGEIFPEKEDAESREKEQAFIFNKTTERWMNYWWPVYIPGITRMTERYMERMNPHIKDEQSEKNYEKVLKIAYGNIGGINFRKYFKEDVVVTREEFEMMNEISKINIPGGNKKNYYKNVSNKIKQIKDSGQPLNREVVAHIYLSEGLKSILDGVDEKVLLSSFNSVTMCYNKLFYQLSTSSEMKILFEKMLYWEKITVSDSNSDSAVDPKLIDELYTVKNVNLSKFIFNFRENITSGFYSDLLFKGNVSDDWFIETEIKKMKENSEPATKPLPEQKNKKNRTSGKQTIPAPDFSKPIFLYPLSSKEMKELLLCVQSFNEIPDVLKECNPDEQKKFRDKHPEYGEDLTVISQTLYNQRKKQSSR